MFARLNQRVFKVDGYGQTTITTRLGLLECSTRRLHGALREFGRQAELLKRRMDQAVLDAWFGTTELDQARWDFIAHGGNPDEIEAIEELFGVSHE